MADRSVGEHETPRERAAPDRLPTDAAHVRTEIADVRVEIANLDKRLSGEMADLRTELRTGLADVRTEMRTGLADVRTEMRTGLADMRTEIAGVQTAIARVGEQHAKTEASRLRWTLGAIIAGSSLGVAVLRLLGD